MNRTKVFKIGEVYFELIKHGYFLGESTFDKRQKGRKLVNTIFKVNFCYETKNSNFCFN